MSPACTFALGEAVKQTAWEQGNWQEAGPLRPGKQAATYRWQAFTRTMEGHPYRLLVVHSDQLDKRKARSLEKALEKERNALEKALADLQKTPFYCQADAEKAIQAFFREQAYPLFCWELEVRVETRVLKRSQRGRPT